MDLGKVVRSWPLRGKERKMGVPKKPYNVFAFWGCRQVPKLHVGTNGDRSDGILLDLPTDVPHEIHKVGGLFYNGATTSSQVPVVHLLDVGVACRHASQHRDRLHPVSFQEPHCLVYLHSMRASQRMLMKLHLNAWDEGATSGEHLQSMMTCHPAYWRLRQAYTSLENIYPCKICAFPRSARSGLYFYGLGVLSLASLKVAVQRNLP